MSKSKGIQFSKAKKILNSFREIGMKPDEIIACMLIIMANDINDINHKLAGKDE